MEVDLSRLAAATAVPDTTGGAPLLLALDSIYEDPCQPRQDFDAAPLEELAASIRERGVRTPISVRPHPEQPGRWMLNFGARRLRASKLAARTDIPAFVDATADSYDQVIENEQREGLKPLELALFVQRQLKRGDSQAEIARRLSKSRTYVTYATALIDAPDWLMGAYREGRCRGARELHELRSLHAGHPLQVEAWASAREAITRDSVAALKADLAAPASAPPAIVAEMTRSAEPSIAPKAAVSATHPVEGPDRQASAPRTRLMLQADLDGELVLVVLDAMPARDGEVNVQRAAGGPARTVAAAQLRLLRVVAG